MATMFKNNESITEHYRRLSQDSREMIVWTNDELLDHHLDTHLMIETDSGMETNRLRMAYAYQVLAIERTEIIRRINGWPSV